MSAKCQKDGHWFLELPIWKWILAKKIFLKFLNFVIFFEFLKVCQFFWIFSNFFEIFVQFFLSFFKIFWKSFLRVYETFCGTFVSYKTEKLVISSFLKNNQCSFMFIWTIFQNLKLLSIHSSNFHLKQSFLKNAIFFRSSHLPVEE